MAPCCEFLGQRKRAPGHGASGLKPEGTHHHHLHQRFSPSALRTPIGEGSRINRSRTHLDVRHQTQATPEATAPALLPEIEG
jgi:hypothetical protein